MTRSRIPCSLNGFSATQCNFRLVFEVGSDVDLIFPSFDHIGSAVKAEPILKRAKESDYQARAHECAD